MGQYDTCGFFFFLFRASHRIILDTKNVLSSLVSFAGYRLHGDQQFAQMRRETVQKAAGTRQHCLMRQYTQDLTATGASPLWTKWRTVPASVQPVECGELTKLICIHCMAWNDNMTLDYVTGSGQLMRTRRRCSTGLPIEMPGESAHQTCCCSERRQVSWHVAT